jgi:hypothetical protein
MRNTLAAYFFVLLVAYPTALLAQKPGFCGSVDDTSAEAVKGEVTRVFNETLDKGKFNTAEGVNVIMWTGWAMADQERIKCLGAPAVPFIVEFLDSPRSFGQLLAVKMLGWAGGSAIVVPLVEVLKEPSTSETIKMSALEALSAAPAANARPILSDISKLDPNQGVRDRATQILATYCPDRYSRSVEIGGDAISGGIFLPGTQMGGLTVRLYSVGVIVWRGLTDRQGLFNIEHLSPGVYDLEVETWGRATVRLDPNQDVGFGGQKAYWSVTLGSNSCVSWAASTQGYIAIWLLQNDRS